MKYIEAPNDYLLKGNELSLFVAGGITGTRQWQKEFVKMLSDLDITIFNPRRENFDVSDTTAAEKQIKWEFEALEDASYISFWFSHETLQPITLYELGRWSTSEKPVLVGCDPKYPRLQDVKIQMSLARPDMVVVDSLEKLADQVRETFLKDFVHNKFPS